MTAMEGEHEGGWVRVKLPVCVCEKEKFMLRMTFYGDMSVIGAAYIQ